VLNSGFAAPTLSLSETGDTEISYTIGEITGANLYRVERSTDGVTYTAVNTHATHGTYTDSTTLTEGQTYYYRVRAENTATSEVSPYSVASLSLLFDFLTASLQNGTTLVGASNPITFTVQPDSDIPAGDSITIAGLTGSQTADGSVTLSGANAAIFGSAGSWTQSTGTLVLTVDAGQTLSTGSDSVITFTLTNPATVNAGVSAVTLDSTGFTQSALSGTFLNAVDIFNVTTRNTEANILASTPSLSAGEAAIAFATDDMGTDNASYTNDFYIYDGSAWYIFNNDSSDPIFDGQLTFPTIQVFDNESDFISEIDAPEHTIVHAKNTDKLYVWETDRWYTYNKDSTV
jgi:hypothetical protein